MRKLAHLKALHALELTARLGGYAAAAREMGVTPAAVGQLVRGLEEALGQPLFHRAGAGAQRLEPNAAATTALPMLTRAFDLLGLAYADLGAKPPQNRVILTASHAVIAQRVLPRLGEFTEAHPAIDVVLNVSDTLLDLAKGEADLAIRCGPGSWAGVENTWLQDEIMLVVCAPQLLNGQDADERWLTRQTLIEDQTPQSHGRLPDWDAWLALAGFRATASTRLRINAPTAILSAAERGQGVALVRSALASQLIGRGCLVTPFPEVHCPARWSYHLLTTESAHRRTSVRLLHDWISEVWKGV
jgi:LysR family glycine cleavage system transcriptional activator